MAFIKYDNGSRVWERKRVKQWVVFDCVWRVVIVILQYSTFILYMTQSLYMPVKPVEKPNNTIISTH